jgi:fluoroacetyl-CoA thioesterase
MPPTTPVIAELAREVTVGDTAAAYDDVFPPAASTPFVLGLAEVACHAAVAGSLADGELTIGTAAEIEHLAPTPVGHTLIARATLVERAGRRLRFEVEVADGDTVVARLHHTRAIAARATLLARLGTS